MVSNFHKFLIHEAEMVSMHHESWNKFVSWSAALFRLIYKLIEIKGNLSRQEAVSMIPPLLIDVEPHHKVWYILWDILTTHHYIIDEVYEICFSKLPPYIF